jgi:hypothetical protein
MPADKGGNAFTIVEFARVDKGIGLGKATPVRQPVPFLRPSIKRRPADSIPGIKGQPHDITGEL